jgi:hypothetical protein
MNPLDIHIPQGEDLPPFENVPYYFPTQKGWMTNMPTLFGVGQTKMKDPPPVLPDLKGSFRLNDRHFPEFLIFQAHAFFKAVWDKQQTESSLYILYNRQDDEFKLWAPEQYVTVTSVNHRLGILPQPWTAAGTIHSHCNFSAFHSGTDQHDMEGMPGLHITIGHVDREVPEYAIALSLGEAQFDVDYEDIIETASVARNDVAYPTHWMAFVKTGHAPWNNGTVTKYKPKTTPNTYQSRLIPPRTHYPSQFRPSSPQSRSRMEHDWNQQAWGSWGNEDDWSDGYGDFLSSHEPTRPVGSEDSFAAALDAPNATDAPSDIFNYYREELADFQYELSLLGDQLEELGFDFDWSISWNPGAAQQRMFDDAPTP